MKSETERKLLWWIHKVGTEELSWDKTKEHLKLLVKAHLDVELEAQCFCKLDATATEVLSD